MCFIFFFHWRGGSSLFTYTGYNQHKRKKDITHQPAWQFLRSYIPRAERPEPGTNPPQTNSQLKFSFTVTHNLYISQYGCTFPETMVLRKERDHLLLRVLEEQLNELFVSRPQLCFISRSNSGEKSHAPNHTVDSQVTVQKHRRPTGALPPQKNNIVEMMLGQYHY